MKWTRIAPFALVTAAIWLPTQAAQTASQTGAPGAAAPTEAVVATTSTAPTHGDAATPPAPAEETITFDQYRDYRIHYQEQRRARLAERLAATGLSSDQKARLERQKEYDDWLAAMPTDQRDRKFRARFDEIDTNRDGKLDTAERAAWREKERSYYRQQAASRNAHEE